jgi:hypothetical protein
MYGWLLIPLIIDVVEEDVLVQPTTSSWFPKIRYIIIFTSTLCLPNGLFPSGFPIKILYAFPFLPSVLHALSSSILHDLSILIIIWQRIQIVKLPVMPFPPTSLFSRNNFLSM